LRRLRDYDVSLRTNRHRNPSGAVVREQRNECAYLFHWEATAEFYRWDCRRGQLCTSFSQPISARAGRACNSFCRATRARRRILVTKPAESIRPGPALPQRFAYGAWASHEATRIIFHPLWRGLSFSCRCSRRFSLTKSHFAKPGIHWRGGNPAADYPSCSLLRRCVRQVLVLDSPLCARVRNSSFDVRCASDPYSQRKGRDWTKLATL